MISVVEPKIENLLAPSPIIVEQRRAAKKKQKCTSNFVLDMIDRLCVFVVDKESSSGEEYQNEEEDDEDEEYENDNDSVEDLEPKSRRSSAAKRKSIAILAKDKTERWGNYRNTIDNGPVPRNYILSQRKKKKAFLQIFVLHRTCIDVERNRFWCCIKISTE